MITLALLIILVCYIFSTVKVWNPCLTRSSDFAGVPRIFTDEENAEVSILASQFCCKDDRSFAEYIRSSRININIRQVNWMWFYFIFFFSKREKGNKKLFKWRKIARPYFYRFFQINNVVFSWNPLPNLIKRKKEKLLYLICFTELNLNELPYLFPVRLQFSCVNKNRIRCQGSLWLITWEYA